MVAPCGQEESMNMRCFPAALVFGFAVSTYGTTSVSAQAAGSNGIPVHTVVTAESHHGSNPPVINREDVMVFEGRDRDAVTDWVPAQGDHAALDLFVMLDDGSNVTLGNQLEDIRHFILGQPAST